MPSDPTGTHPQGVLVRPAPDFFDDNVGWGGYWVQPTVAFPYVTISLYNDAPFGQCLKVYGITNGDDAGFGTFCYQRQGPPLGNFITQCDPIRFDRGAPPGQIWARIDSTATVTSPYPLPLPPNTKVLGTPGFASQTVGLGFPFAVIPAGYSLVLANANNAATVYASFWYQVANE